MPRQATLEAGGACLFKVSGHPDPMEVWRWTLSSGTGEIEAATGLYRASGPGAPVTARVRATATGDPGLWGEATVVVLSSLMVVVVISLRFPALAR